MNVNKLLKSALKTSLYLLEESDGVAADVRERVADGAVRASNRVSDLRERAEHFYRRDDQTVRNMMTLAVGIAVGIGAGLLLAPASGEEIRNSIGKQVHDIGDRVRNRFSAEGSRQATGTEGT